MGCATGLEYIRKLFPTSASSPDLELIIGDSTKMVPQYIAQHPDRRGTCDFISVDGGHFGQVPKLDIMNIAAYANSAWNMVVVDDIDSPQPASHFLGTVGRAWDNAANTGLIKQALPSSAQCKVCYLPDVQRTTCH